MRAQVTISALLLAATALARAESSPSSVAGWDALARSTLLRELQIKRPDVSRWEIEPRLSDHQREQLADAVVDEALVTLQGSRSIVRLRWRARGKQQMTSVWFATRGFGTMFVAKEKLSARELLSPESGKWSVRDVMGLRCDPVIDEQTLLGMRTRIPIQEGEPICRDKIEPTPLVTKDREVTVRSFSGPVLVTGKAVSQADGQLGEKLRVKSSSSGVVYSAVVTGEQQVSVYD